MISNYGPSPSSRSPRKECHVVKIDLSSRPEFVGTLDPHLAELPDLEVFDLTGNKTYEGIEGNSVDGNIAVFEKSKKLRHLNLAYSDVSGTLMALKNSKELRYLNLANTYSVACNLAALENAAELTYLNLGYSMEVSGNLEALKKATRLKELNLQYTNVDGDVMALENATELTHLDLADTHVVGDLSGLRPLEHCDVSGTEITCKGEEDALRKILVKLGLKEAQRSWKKFPAWNFGVFRKMLSCRYAVFPLYSFR